MRCVRYWHSLSAVSAVGGLVKLCTLPSQVTYAAKWQNQKLFGGLGEAIILSAIAWLASITVLLIPVLPSAASPLPPYFFVVQSLIASAYIASMVRGVLRGRKANKLKLAEELPWRTFLHSTQPSDFCAGEEVEK